MFVALNIYECRTAHLHTALTVKKKTYFSAIVYFSEMVKNLLQVC